MKLRTGDKVQIIAGKYLGVKSEVLQVFNTEGKVLVKDVNVVVKHIKKQGDNDGGRIKIEKPIDISKVMLICTHENKPVRVGYKIVDGKKVRVCKKCKKTL